MLMTVLRPDNVSSPVDPLLRHLAPALANIVPERIDAIFAATADHTLFIVDDARFVCHFDHTTKTITISRGVVEVMWALSHAYFVLFDRVLAGRLVTAPVVFDLTTNADLKRAMETLAWALNRHLHGDSDDWPATLPHPVPKPAQDSDESVSDELALCAVAFLLHHELAHSRFKHLPLPEGADSIDQERQADYEAAEWILGRLDGPSQQMDPFFRKRTLGVSVALTFMVAVGIHSGSHGGKKHPRHFDRLINTLDRHISDPNHPTWSFIIGPLALHMDSAQLTRPTGPFDSFRACADAYAERLAALSA